MHTESVASMFIYNALRSIYPFLNKFLETTNNEIDSKIKTFNPIKSVLFSVYNRRTIFIF